MLRKATWILVIVAASGALAPAGRAADSLLNWDGQSIVRLYHLYSAADGRSYLEEMAVPLQEYARGAKQIFNSDVQNVHVGSSPPGPLIDWHYATHVHFIMPLRGELVFDLGDGRDYRLRPGEAVLAEDWTGKGHRSGCDPQSKIWCVALDVTVGPIDKRLPLREPPTPTHR